MWLGFPGVNRDDHDGGAEHPIHVGMDGSNGNGAYLSTSGTWTDASSRTLKTDFEPIQGEEILAKIARLPIESWKYKGSAGRHIGPVAEDFAHTFEVGNTLEDGRLDDKYMASSDVAGVALAGEQQLISENGQLRERVRKLETLVESLLSHSQNMTGH